jgi:hypothetical protein
MRHAFLRLALIALLLVAQHAALTHAIWHAYRDGPSAHQRHANNSRTGGGHVPEHVLCVFDVAFGQVLGATHGSASHFCAPELASELIAQSARPYTGVVSLSFHSRAPPVLL